ncbi:MAG: lactate utilization protein [Syntrophales bacterium]|nr:lactate utilization protein [Syntrophales bacterium]
MKGPIERYWDLKLEEAKKNLEKNGFEVFIAESVDAVLNIVRETVLPAVRPRTVSWGGSMTLAETGLLDFFRAGKSYEVIDTADKNASREENLERRRKALLADLFFSGTNAVTEDGRLVNLDAIGNRVAALAYGPRSVVVVTGRNKIVAGLDEAVTRIKDYAAPVNCMRLDRKTPCAETASCGDCDSPGRICNAWLITEKSWPAGRIRVVLVNADLGY